MRSYSAARREVLGVSGAVIASGPRWCTGVEGIEEELGGVSEKEVRILEGVRNPSESRIRVDGVCGKGTRPLVGDTLRLGVIGNGTEFLEGVAVRLEGVAGKGTPNAPRARLTGDLAGDFENAVGDGGVARMVADAGDLGEDEASRRVRVEGCFATGNGGRIAIGI